MTVLLLLLSLLSLSASVIAQDGYNLFKDVQRGRVELESVLADEDRQIQIDHSAHTWPSVGARVQVPSSTKRTLDLFKVEEDSEHDHTDAEETGIEFQNEGEDEVRTAVIPRTRASPKRGRVLWRMPQESDQVGIARDIFWILENRELQPSGSLKDSLEVGPKPASKCSFYQSNNGVHYRCNWRGKIIVLSNIH